MIVMQQRFGAPSERVFVTLTDHAAFGRALGEDIGSNARGVPAPNGLGARCADPRTRPHDS